MSLSKNHGKKFIVLFLLQLYPEKNSVLNLLFGIILYTYLNGKNQFWCFYSWMIVNEN